MAAAVGLSVNNLIILDILFLEWNPDPDLSLLPYNGKHQELYLYYEGQLWLVEF